MEQIKEYVQEQIVRLTDEIAENENAHELLILEHELKTWEALVDVVGEAEEPDFYNEDDIIAAAYNAMINVHQIEEPTDKQRELMDEILDKGLKLTSFAIDRLYKDMHKQLKHEKEQRKAAKKEDTDEQ